VEGLDVLEVPVDGGEAHVRDLIEVLQFLHDQLTDGARGNLAVPEAAHPMHDAAHGLVDLLARHRALLQRLLHAGTQLALIECLAPAITLDHERHDELRGLEGREALAALQALASAANLSPLAGEARVVHLSLLVAAERAVHAA